MTYEDFKKVVAIVEEASKLMDIEDVLFLEEYDSVEVMGDKIAIDYDIENDTVNINAGGCVGEPHIEISDMKITERGLKDDILFLVRVALFDKLND